MRIIRSLQQCWTWDSNESTDRTKKLIFRSNHENNLDRNIDPRERSKFPRHYDDYNTGVLVLSREVAVNEALPCDQNRFLVRISNLKKSIYFSQFKCEFCFLVGIWKCFLVGIHFDYSKMSFWSELRVKKLGSRGIVPIVICLDVVRSTDSVLN